MTDPSEDLRLVEGQTISAAFYTLQEAAMGTVEAVEFLVEAVANGALVLDEVGRVQLPSST